MTNFQVPEGFVALDDSCNVYKKITTEGTGAKPIRTGTNVVVHYTGSLFTTGDVFDSSVTRGDPFEFQIGKGMVIKGWDVGIASMNIGEHAELLIKPEYGYGKNGSPPKIPGDSVLLFKVELISFDESTAELSIPEKISKANEAKEKGNTEFKSSSYSKAQKSYESALKYIEDTFGADNEDGEIVKNLKLSLNSNLAAVNLKLNEAGAAAKNCKNVLDIEPKHPKALYRLVQANTILGKYDDAISLLESNREVNFAN